MERARNKTTEVEIKEDTGERRYKKVGGGSLRFKGQIIKPGQVFLARPEDIKPGWRDLVLPLDGQEVPKSGTATPQVKAKLPEYKKVPRGKSTLWFDVVGPTNKPINGKALKSDEADELIADLAK